MKTFFFPLAVVLAAFVSAERGDPLPDNVIVDLDEPVGPEKAHCCYLYGHADYEYDTRDEDDEDFNRNYVKKEFCLEKNIFGETMISPFSFINSDAPNGGVIMDNLESYKCGTSVAMEVCSETYYKETVIGSEKYGTFLKYKCSEQGTLSVAAPGDRVSFYHQRQNLASSIILYPIKAPDCVVLYSMYDLAGCEGNQYTVSKSFENRDEMDSAFPDRFLTPEGATRTIRSVKHPAKSRVTVWTEENFTGGAWQSENVSTVDDRPDFVCTTFRFDQAAPVDLLEAGDGLDLDMQMPQGSVEWWYEDCGEPILDLGSPDGVYFWVISDKYLQYQDAAE